MFKKQEPEFDVVLELLHAVIEAQPKSEFAKSLLQQYLERGSLSKKQLQGLHNKASKIRSIPSGRLATLEATIIKMPNRFKSELPAAAPLYKKDESIGQMIEAILQKYPQHKTVLLLKAKYDNNEILSSTELADLKKFTKLLTK